MGEKVRVRQNSKFEIQFWGSDPQDPEAGELQPVSHLHALTPYGMMLASLGSCTTIVLHTYAQNHNIQLDEVEILLEYERFFDQQSDLPDEIQSFDEQIQEQIQFFGDFSTQQREKLFRVSHQCSIHKMFESGIEIRSQMVEQA